MSFKILERYINKCKVNGIEPTLIGAEIFKKYGILLTNKI
ncbi:Hypothetical protein CCH01_014020 [Clostridium chauvoei JF4335]|uniref:Uncharacterized protein n=1 Tax=Clostridium chauvoei JF4335 TaxID=1351755 RepID=S6FN96_9CLOT|nr:Hypothetical protein CCH01_014020 [Clostridium chauvoei JF4335]SLK19710.1 Hypothetical protein CCH01_17450 [Clostridium chauvoei JF4335]